MDIQWSVNSGSLTPETLNGWPGWIVSGPSSLSASFNVLELDSGYMEYSISGSAILSISGTNYSCSGNGRIALTLRGDTTFTLVSSSTYVLGNFRLIGFKLAKEPEFSSTTQVLFERELTSPNPLLRIISPEAAVYVDSVCRDYFKGNKCVGFGPGYYKVISSGLGKVIPSEGPTIKAEILCTDNN